jgi:predicted ester cyclase
VDSLGNHVVGDARLRQAWQWYFGAFPDYRIEIEVLVVGADCVLLSGVASATHLQSGRKWSIPAAWKARIAAARVAHWQVYADNKPVYEILGGGA